MSVRILAGDCRTTLATLPDQSVHCVVTSPPYFGLRDYGVDGQIGLESTADAFVAEMVAVFREVRRVLRDDGTLWLNLGDSYATNGGAGYQGKNGQRADRRFTQESLAHRMNRATRNRGDDEIKPKDLMMIPATVALALRADGWYLRSEIVWAKPNPMPESVTDRPTKSHEMLYLLSKSPTYHYDSDAIREDAVSSWDPDNAKQPDGWDTGEGAHGAFRRNGREAGKSGNKARRPASDRGVPVDTNGATSGDVAGSVPREGTTRNKRSVWTVATQPFKGAHFATFPPALIEPCILAGCPRDGTVLDPFGGAGTTGLVADRLGRNAILCELNPEYITMIEARIRGESPLFAQVSTE